MRTILATGLAATLLAVSSNASVAYEFNFGKIEKKYVRPQASPQAQPGYANTFHCIPGACPTGNQQSGARRTTPKLTESAINGNSP